MKEEAQQMAAKKYLLGDSSTVAEPVPKSRTSMNQAARGTSVSKFFSLGGTFKSAFFAYVQTAHDPEKSFTFFPMHGL